MADLPVGIAVCNPVLQSNPQYRAVYECVSYVARATGSNWHAEIPVPDRPDFVEFDFRVTLPPELAKQFSLHSIKRVTRTDDPQGGKFNSFSLTFFGTATLGDCKPAPERCVVEKGVSATLYYK